MFRNFINKWMEGKSSNPTATRRPPIKPIQPALAARVAAVHVNETSSQQTNAKKTPLSSSSERLFYHPLNKSNKEGTPPDEAPHHSKKLSFSSSGG